MLGVCFCYSTQNGTRNNEFLFFTIATIDKEITICFSSFTKIYIVEERDNILAWFWFHSYIGLRPKHLGGAFVLILEDHMVGERFSPLKCMDIGTQPWMKMIYYFVEKIGIHHGKTRVVASMLVQKIVCHWQKSLELFNWHPLERLKNTNSLSTKVLTSSQTSTLGWKGNSQVWDQLWDMAWLGNFAK